MGRLFGFVCFACWALKHDARVARRAAGAAVSQGAWLSFPVLILFGEPLALGMPDTQKRRGTDFWTPDSRQASPAGPVPLHPGGCFWKTRL